MTSPSATSRESVVLAGGGHDVHLGNVGTSQAPAVAVLSGGFNNVSMKNVLSGSIFAMLGSGHDITFGNIAAGALVSIGFITDCGAIHDFTGGDIAGYLLAFDSFRNGSVKKISGFVFLEDITGKFTTTSGAAGRWDGATSLTDGGDILLGTASDKVLVKTA